MQLTVGPYRLSFPDDLKHETYECRDYHGVIFTVDGVTFDVVCNKALGERLLISRGLGHMKDIPFRLETSGFLPEVIRTEHAPVF